MINSHSDEGGNEEMKRINQNNWELDYMSLGMKIVIFAIVAILVQAFGILLL